MTFVVIFDLDGTLVDTPTAITEAFRAAFTAVGATPPAEQAVRATIGLPLEQAFAQLLGTPSGDTMLAELATQYQFAFREIALPRAAELVFPGVVEGLEVLHRRGFQLAIATSKYLANAEALLSAAGLRHHFSLVIGADLVAQAKPDPETAHAILRAFEITADRAVVVGDTTFDIHMANAAAIASVAVTYGVHDMACLLAAGPTWVCDNFGDVVIAVQSVHRRAIFHHKEVCHYVRYDGIFY